MIKTIATAAKTPADASSDIVLSEAELAVVTGGKPDHKPIDLTKEIGAATPSLFS